MPFGTRAKVLTACLCAGIIPLLVLGLLSLIAADLSTRKAQSALLETSLDSALQAYTDCIKKNLLICRLLQGDTHLKTLLKEGRPDTLSDYLNELYPLCKDYIEYINIKDTQGAVVAKAGEAPTSGQDPSGIRTATPIYNEEGKALGTLEVDKTFDSLANSLKESSGLDVTIYSGETAQASTLEGIKGTTLEDPKVDRKVLRQGKRYITKGTSGTKSFMTAYAPIRDNSDKIIGALSVSRPVPMTSIASTRPTLLYTLAGTLAASILTIVLTTLHFFRPWKKLSQGIKALSEGDVTHRVGVQEGKEGELALSLNKIAESLEKQAEELKEMGQRDRLTGLYTYPFLQGLLRAEYDRSRRYGQHLSCIMIDLDHFQEINKEHGQAFGDYVLTEAAKLLLGIVRNSDAVARYGGEEFFIVLPVVDVDAAMSVAQRIQRVFGYHIFLKNSSSTKLTVSMGISGITDQNITSPSDLTLHAQQALQKAKEQGGNTLCLWRDIV
ncbi:MAG: diguanylate cyclase [Candidatus Brocadiales bacterium]|nr:diguanylate cyclase [Candidatus Brocadiales bacterium]